MFVIDFETVIDFTSFSSSFSSLLLLFVLLFDFVVC